MKERSPLLQVRDLSVYVGLAPHALYITDKLSFDIYPGEIFALVGESGCGKSMTAQAILGLLGSMKIGGHDGDIRFLGENLGLLPEAAMQALRGSEISMIFQEASHALNPLIPLGRQLEEVFQIHHGHLEQDLQKRRYLESPKARIRELLQRMGFQASQSSLLMEAFPHQLSGGMLQRLMIAMALLLSPKLLIADEPTTALDVSIQAQVMELLLENAKRENTAVLLITHNLGLLAQYADRLAVMYAGRIIESAASEDFFAKALHPYSIGLLRAFPDPERKKELRAIPGQVPSAKEYSADHACRFRKRCACAFDLCNSAGSVVLHERQKAHLVACSFYEKAASIAQGRRAMEAAL